MKHLQWWSKTTKDKRMLQSCLFLLKYIWSASFSFLSRTFTPFHNHCINQFPSSVFLRHPGIWRATNNSWTVISQAWLLQSLKGQGFPDERPPYSVLYTKQIVLHTHRHDQACGTSIRNHVATKPTTDSMVSCSPKTTPFMGSVVQLL